MLATVHRQCLVMMNLVNELLDLARIEARRDLDFRFEVVSLPKLAADAVAAFLPPGGREPVRVTAADGSAVDWQVQVDSEKFQRDSGYIVGSGPYAFDQWVTGQKIVLKKKKNCRIKQQ